MINKTTNNVKAASWMVSFFGVPPKPKMVEEDKPREKRIGRAKEFSETQKNILRDHIKAAIDDDTTHFEEIWDEILVIERKKGVHIIPRAKSDGKLMSKKTFRDYVLKVKQSISFRVISKKEIVLKLAKAGKTDKQINKEHGISLRYINQVMVLDGQRPSNAKWYKQFRYQELEKTNNDSASV